MKPLEQANILIVDDAEFNRLIIKTMLENEGFENLFVAVNGKEALDVASTHPPDIVILDIFMPEMDGLEFCAHAVKDPHLKDVPILVQTSESDPDSKAQAFEIGASDFIHKPIDMREMISRVQVHLKNRFMLQELQEYKREMDVELGTAKQMMEMLLPDNTKIEICQTLYNVAMSACLEPCYYVGGDLWGIRPINERQFAFYMVDFSGHGVTAAMNVFRFQLVLNEYFSNHFQDSVLHGMEFFNKNLWTFLKPEQYATMFYAIADIEAHTLSFTSAGAPSGLIITKGGEEKILPNEGLPIGLTSDATHDPHVIEFAPGDILIAHSDVLLETSSKAAADDGLLVEKDVMEMVKSHRPISRSTAEDINNSFKTTMGREILEDDFTLLIIKRQ